MSVTESGLLYLIKSHAVLSLLFLAYLLCLRKEKFFHLNRCFLMAVLLFSVILPLLPAIPLLAIPSWPDPLTTINPFRHLARGIHSGRLPVQSVDFVRPLSLGSSLGRLTYLQLLLGFYLLVSSIRALRLGRKVLQVVPLIRTSRKQVSAGVIYCSHEQPLPPFSFFHYLLLNPAPYSPQQLEQIVAHEYIHIRQWHSIDILLAEMVHVFLWINPLMGLMKRAVQLNLEFLADQQVLAAGADRKSYQWNLLHHCLTLATYPLTNGFAASRLKRRIQMMNAPASPIHHLYKYGLVMALMGATYGLINLFSGQMVEAARAERQERLFPRPLNAFEGIYQFQEDQDAFFQLTAKPGGLLLQQLWDGREIGFTRRSDLTFWDDTHQFPLIFKESPAGVLQAKAFDQDWWHPVKQYVPVLKKEVTLPLHQLKAFEGTYQFQGHPTAFIHIRAHPNRLVLQQRWDGQEIPLVAESELAFFRKDGRFSLQFVQNEDGVVTQALALGRDWWKKVNE